MQTFLFYDIETTGLNKSFDQVLQFAGIRTDTQLNEIERYHLNVKLNTDVIPSPQALMTHHIGISSSEGLSEYDAIQQIHRWMNQPNTLSLGYNTLGFDDEFLRFSFFRNLLPPYTHQFANQCGRLDIYPMTIMYYLFKNELIKWPMKDGKISLKLENINHNNLLAKGRAHDAMVDVEATLALAKLFYQEQTMWDYLVGYFSKSLDAERSLSLKNSIALYVEGVLGFVNAYQCPVMYLGEHRHYKNQTLWLRLDNEFINTATPENFNKHLYVITKKMGEPGFILPLKNRFLQQLTPDRLALAENNFAWLNNNPDKLLDIVHYYSEYKHPVYQNTDADATLYIKGFRTFAEERFCEHFHKAKPPEKAKMIEQQPHSVLKTQAIRIVGRHFPDMLTSPLKDEYHSYLASIHPEQEENALIDFQNKKRLTPKSALQQIETIRQTVAINHEQQKLLTELEGYLKKTFQTG